MAQLTAVEWLRKISNRRKLETSDFRQAKEMEKEQIVNAYIDGEHQQGFEGEAEQYYNETYQSNQVKADN